MEQIFVLTCALYPVLKTLCVHIHSAVTGSYVAGYHSVLLVNCPTEQTAKDIGREIKRRKRCCMQESLGDADQTLILKESQTDL
ncbi:hypothetical protein ROHU_010986 [Labeo rohita]|uniref:Uncharacterized protein n=1 Tax=Labeo rohita TaxID=84645 RepID=A0A498LMA1_LABRO|nr:hypothetical protein ROHU_010986 [Labeo rohita]